MWKNFSFLSFTFSSDKKKVLLKYEKCSMLNSMHLVFNLVAPVAENFSSVL